MFNWSPCISGVPVHILHLRLREVRPDRLPGRRQDIQGRQGLDQQVREAATFFKVVTLRP